jgi:hypothetical protein
VITTHDFTSGQVVRRIVLAAAVVAGLATGYVWATQGKVFDIGDGIAAVTHLALRLSAGA